MKSNNLYLGFLIIFAVGLGVAGVAAGRLVVPAEGEEKPLGAKLLVAWADVAAAPFAGGFVLMLIGGLGARRLSAKTTLEGRGAADDPAAILSEIKKTLSAIDAHSSEAAALLSEILEEQVNRVVDQRDRLIARHGVGNYAEFAGDFASFERNAARAWSAITDGVLQEAEQSLLSADAALERAVASYDRLAA